jgi:hypothetical protein
MGARHLLSRAGTCHECRVLVFLFPRTGATPFVGDLGKSTCRDLTVHILTVVVCSRHYVQPMAVWGKSEEDRQRLRKWKDGQMGKIEIMPHLRLTLAVASLFRQLRNRTLTALILLFSTLPALAQNIDRADVIVGQENAFWRAYTAGNVTDLASLLQQGFTNVEQEIWTRDQVFAFVQQFHKQCSLAPVTLVDPHVSFLTSDIATIVYHANEAATCGTRTMSGDTNIATVWVHRDGHWQMHLHSEYTIPGK